MKQAVIWAWVVASGLSFSSFAQDVLKVTDGKAPPPDAAPGRAARLQHDYRLEAGIHRHGRLGKAAPPKFASRSWCRRGFFRCPPRPRSKPVIFGRIDKGDYTIDKVYFASMPGHYVVGNLYRPKNASGKLPVVLYTHGHWADGRLNEASDAEVNNRSPAAPKRRPKGAKYFLQAPVRDARADGVRGLRVQHGRLRRLQADRASQGVQRCGRRAAPAKLHGPADMEQHPQPGFRPGPAEGVDPSRVAITGASGGGTQSLILSAIDPRVTVSFPAVMTSENMQGGCICENASLLRVGSTTSRFAAAFAPKPQGMTGANDWTSRHRDQGPAAAQADLQPLRRDRTTSRRGIVPSRTITIRSAAS